jgi:tetratricopeptide (TPR) repeat protein
MSRRSAPAVRAGLLAVFLFGLVCSGQGQDRAEDRFRFAEGLLARRFHDLAETQLRSFLEQHRDHSLAPRAALRLVECLRAQDRSADALAAIRDFEGWWPEHDLLPRLNLLRGQILLDQGHLGDARKALEQSLAAPEPALHEAAQYFLARTLTRQGRSQEALNLFRELAGRPFAEDAVYRPYALFSVASALQAAGQYGEAGEAFGRLAGSPLVPDSLREEAAYRVAEMALLQGEFARAVELCDSVLAAYPDGRFVREVLKRKGWALFAQGRYTEAVDVLARCREAGTVRDHQVEYLYGAGLVALKMYEEALPILKSLYLDEKVSVHYRELASFQAVCCRLHTGDFLRAVGESAKFVNLFPDSRHVHEVLYFGGEAAYRLEDYTRARELLEKAMARAPADWNERVEAGRRLAECLEKLKSPAEAAAVYERLASWSSDDTAAYYTVLAGERLQEAGQRDRAVAVFESVLANTPGAPAASVATRRLGDLYAAERDYVRAEALTRRLLEVEESGPGRDRLLLFLGYLCFRQGRHSEAETFLRQAIEQAAADDVEVEARYFLGGTLLDQGRDEEALAVFAEVLSRPDTERPDFDESLLFRLEALYFSQARYEISERICRWLINWRDAEVVRRARLRLAEILIARKEFSGAAAALEPLEKDVADPGPEVQSLLAEVHLLLGHRDRAVTGFEAAVAAAEAGSEAAVRAHWGLARILTDEGVLNRALEHAAHAFVLGRHPRYTPRAMVLAITCLVRQDKTEEARQTWEELRVRFPSAAAEARRDPELVELWGKLGLE